MQNQTVVQLPLESYRAIKKQFEVEIDVPPGLLPATWCSPAGGQLTALLHRRGRALPTTISPHWVMPKANTAQHIQPHWDVPTAVTRAVGIPTQWHLAFPYVWICCCFGVFWVFFAFFPAGPVPQCDTLHARSQGIKSQSVISRQ